MSINQNPIGVLAKLPAVLAAVLWAVCQSPPAFAAETSINIVTYNIRVNSPGDGENAWPNRKDKVAGLLRFHGADLFTIQEALPEQMDDLAERLPEFDHVGVGRDDGKRGGEHVAIFYNKKRFTKIDDGVFWLSETPERPSLGWDAARNRTCTWIKVKDSRTDKAFFVFDTHIDHKGRVAKQEGIKLILARMREINKENLPLILAGDFNLVKNSRLIQPVLSVLSDARDKSISEPYGPEGTAAGFAVKEKASTIDFIFINDKVTVLRHGVLSDTFGLYHLSDHMPVLAEIRLE